MRKSLPNTLVSVSISFFAAIFSTLTIAQTNQVSPQLSSQPVIIPAAPQLAASSYILIDANSGQVIVEKNADQALPPASITKLMTSYILASEIERGAITTTDKVDISVKAWKKGGSKMFVREGAQVPVIDLMRGMIIQSGNDATIALAEHIAGSEEAFADVMNQQAALLGMINSNFKNATGWPAENHYSSAKDISTLARALIQEHPEIYKLYSEKYFSYNGINQTNRNKLLFRDKTVDGVKTGHTEEAGYCLVASSEKDGMRLISVVMGTRSDEARAKESQKLLAYGFRYFLTHKLYNEFAPVSESRIWKGKAETISLGVNQDVYLTIPRGAEKGLVANASIDQVISAPVSKGQELGSMVVTLDGKEMLTLPLVALNDVESAGFFSRLTDSVVLFFKNLF
jgi:D-alanyl-D-alanine carboxypeptidase (penicillin-binding protein 5/6)